jgi:hypothetical protein
VSERLRHNAGRHGAPWPDDQVLVRRAPDRCDRRRRGDQQHQGAAQEGGAQGRSRGGPWLNEVAVVLADLGLREIARNTGAQLGGTPIAGDIGLEGERFVVYVTLFPGQRLARQAELGLRTNPEVRSAIAKGAAAVRTADRAVFVANGRGSVVDEFRLDEVVRLVGRVAVPPPLKPAAAVPPPAGVSSPPDPDVLEQLRKLGNLRRTGVLTDAEFEAKKAELWGACDGTEVSGALRRPAVSAASGAISGAADPDQDGHPSTAPSHERSLERSAGEGSDLAHVD